MKELPKEKITGIAATVIFHILLVVLLYFLVMTTPPQQEEMGIEGQMGIDNDAFGDRLAMAETPASAPSSVPAPEPEPQPLAASYEEALALLGVADVETPQSIYIYPKDFEAKDIISEEIEKYNKEAYYYIIKSFE